MSIELVMPFNHLILCPPLLLLLSIFPASGSFPMSQFLASGGQSIRVSASASVFPMNIQDWFPLGLTGWISLQSKRLSRVFSNTTVQKYQFFSAQLSLYCNSHPYMTSGKTMALTRWTFVDIVMYQLFKMLSRLVIAFLPRSKHLLISWLQSLSAVILEPKKENMSLFPILFHLFAIKWWDEMPMILVFWMLNFKPAFSLSSFPFKRLYSSSLPSAIRVVSSMYLRSLIFLPAILILACASSPVFSQDVLCIY